MVLIPGWVHWDVPGASVQRDWPGARKGPVPETTGIGLWSEFTRAGLEPGSAVVVLEPQSMKSGLVLRSSGVVLDSGSSTAWGYGGNGLEHGTNLV